jgi:uracil-DNA glycosylase
MPEGAQPRIVFVMESPGIAEGGAAQTGVVNPATNADATARNGNKLREQAGIPLEACFFANTVMHAAMTDEGRMRSPRTAEARNCSRLLEMIIDAINPAIVAPVGSWALKALNFIELHGKMSVLSNAGKPFTWYERTVFPLCHYSPLGLANRPLEKQVEDFNGLAKLLQINS